LLCKGEAQDQEELEQSDAPKTREVRTGANRQGNEEEPVNKRQEKGVLQKDTKRHPGHPSVTLVIGWPKAHANLHKLHEFRLGDGNLG
jgi:hypothetical protein